MATNGTTETTEPKPEALLSKLHKQFLDRGGKPPNAAEGKALIAAWKKATKAREEAEAVFVKAQEGQAEAVKAIITAYGKGQKRIDGKVYIPMSRGDTCYLREVGGGEVQDIG